MAKKKASTSAWSATASWAARIPMPGARVSNFFDTGYQPVLKAVCGAQPGEGARASPTMWGYESIGDRLAQADRAQRHRRDRHLHAERHATPRSPSPRPRPARWCSARSRSPALPRKACRWCEAVEKAGVPNMVWYNYRRVPAVTPDQAAHRRGQARQDLPLPRQVPAGLDHLGRRAAGRRRHLAARCRRGGLRRHRRSARALHRHRALAQRRRSPTSPR